MPVAKPDLEEFPDKDAVLRYRSRTWIYLNNGGRISIRQSQEYDDDVIIIIAPEDIPAFITGLSRILHQFNSGELTIVSDDNEATF